MYKRQQLNRELNIAKARNASLSETRKIEDEILSERTKAHNKSVGFYGQELNDLEANRAKLKQLNDMLVQLNNAKARGDKKVYIDVDLDGKIDKVKVDEAIDAVQGQIDNTGRAVDIAVNLKTEGADLDAERKIQAAQRANENRNAAKAETDILRKAEDARIALIKNSFDQQRAQRQAANSRAIADIQLQNAECFFHTQFHGQSMSIPSGLTLYLEPLHRFVTAEKDVYKRQADCWSALWGADKACLCSRWESLCNAMNHSPRCCSGWMPATHYNLSLIHI